MKYSDDAERVKVTARTAHSHGHVAMKLKRGQTKVKFLDTVFQII